MVLPLLLILGAIGGAMGYYFWRVTGNPLVMPYTVNQQTYAVAPYFVLAEPEPVYHHAVMREFYTDLEMRGYRTGNDAGRIPASPSSGKNALDILHGSFLPCVSGSAPFFSEASEFDGLSSSSLLKQIYLDRTVGSSMIGSST